MCKKLARGSSEGYDRYKTKIDKVKAEKKALQEKLRRSEARVRRLEGLVVKSKPEKEEEEKPRDFETRETETI